MKTASAKMGKRVALAAVSGLAVIPLLLLAARSLAQSWFWPSLLPPVWSLRAWQYVFSPAAEVLPALMASLSIALLVTLPAVLVALPAARVLAWREFRGKRAVIFALLLPVLTPPLAATMGVHALFLRYGLTDTLIGVALSHLIATVPYATLMLTGSFSRLDPDYEAQARTLGANGFAVLRHVTFPAIAPGLAVAASFAFLISWSQYLTTLLIGGGRIVTLPLTLVSFQRGGDEAIAAALSLVFLAPAAAVAFSVARFLKEGK
ncbi:MAG TPA: ABC transporter permease subunit [Blastocatellia bacterium]|nr:ABC transporter permease subunit [Blastocatellia bacterium]